jgi:hypothetical protein
MLAGLVKRFGPIVTADRLTFESQPADGWHHRTVWSREIDALAPDQPLDRAHACDAPLQECPCQHAERTPTVDVASALCHDLPAIRSRESTGRVDQRSHWPLELRLDADEVLLCGRISPRHPRLRALRLATPGPATCRYPAGWPATTSGYGTNPGTLAATDAWGGDMSSLLHRSHVDVSHFESLGADDED